MKAVKFLSALLFTSLMAICIAALFNIHPLIIGGVFFIGGSMIPSMQNILAMAITKEIWSKDIVELIFPVNEFADKAVSADDHVLAGAVVHKPTAGAAATTKKNLTVFPQVAVQRTDTDATYALDTYYIVPRMIKNIDKYELAYDKRMSVVGQDVKGLVDCVHKGLLYNWAPLVGKTFLTTGADSALDLIDSTATGTRKLLTPADLKKAIKALHKNNLTSEIYALLTASHYHQFLEGLSDGEKTNFGRVADLAKGIVGEYYGAKIMMRSAGLRYRGADGAYVAVDESADAFAADASDRAASLVWNAGSVERAKGSVETFSNEGDPLYYGDTYSANCRMGGKIIRAAGVYAIVEAIGA